MLTAVTDDDARMEMRGAPDEIEPRRCPAHGWPPPSSKLTTTSPVSRASSTPRAGVSWSATATPRRASSPRRGAREVPQEINDNRVGDDGERCRFRSSILPPWAPKSPKVAEVLPLMYLHGDELGSLRASAGRFFGSSAGLSASVIPRLATQWQAEQTVSAEREPVGPGLRVRVHRRRAVQRAFATPRTASTPCAPPARLSRDGAKGPKAVAKIVDGDSSGSSAGSRDGVFASTASRARHPRSRHFRSAVRRHDRRRSAHRGTMTTAVRDNFEDIPPQSVGSRHEK